MSLCWRGQLHGATAPSELSRQPLAAYPQPPPPCLISFVSVFTFYGTQRTMSVLLFDALLSRRSSATHVCRTRISRSYAAFHW